MKKGVGASRDLLLPLLYKCHFSPKVVLTLGVTKWKSSVKNAHYNRQRSSLFADLQHHLMVSLPLGQKSRHPGAAVPRGDERLPWGQGARQRRHRKDAISEGCHQGDATVRGKILLPEFFIYSVYFSLSRKEPHSLILFCFFKLSM